MKSSVEVMLRLEDSGIFMLLKPPNLLNAVNTSDDFCRARGCCKCCESLTTSDGLCKSFGCRELLATSDSFCNSLRFCEYCESLSTSDGFAGILNSVHAVNH